MKQDAISIEQALAAAIGDDAALFAELRVTFLESAGRHALSLACAREAGEWRNAAWRLKSSSASFGATELMAAADAASRAPPGDAASLAAVGRAVAALTE